MCALIFMRKYMFHHCWNIYNIQVIVTITSTFLGHRQGQCPSRKNFTQRVAFSWRVWRDGRTVKLLKYICAYFHPNCAKFLPLRSSFFFTKSCLLCHFLHVCYRVRLTSNTCSYIHWWYYRRWQIFGILWYGERLWGVLLFSQIPPRWFPGRHPPA